MTSLTDFDFYTAIKNAQSLHGTGQKLNEIIEDTLALLYTALPTFEISNDTMWKCLFKPVPSFLEHKSIHGTIYNTLTDPIINKVFICICTALEDPPAKWWRARFQEYT